MSLYDEPFNQFCFRKRGQPPGGQLHTKTLNPDLQLCSYSSRYRADLAFSPGLIHYLSQKTQKATLRIPGWLSG